jgi:hypothetical protein
MDCFTNATVCMSDKQYKNVNMACVPRGITSVAIVSEPKVSLVVIAVSVVLSLTAVESEIPSAINKPTFQWDILDAPM